MARRESWWSASSRRIPGFRYALPGSYLVTFCTARRAHLLSRVEGRSVELTAAGTIVREVWLGLEGRFAGISLGVSVLMPDHVHAIIHFLDSLRELRERDRPTLPRVVGAWKSLSSIRIARQLGLDSSSIWQKSFIDRVIRNEAESYALRAYILQNPQRWTEKHKRVE